VALLYAVNYLINLKTYGTEAVLKFLFISFY